MSEWNRYGRHDRSGGYEAERRGDWGERDRDRDQRRDWAGRESRSFQGGRGHHQGGYGGGGYGQAGYGERTGLRTESYIEPGGPYGGEVYDRPAYGARSYGGHDYSSGGRRSGAYDDDSRFDYGRSAYGEGRSFGDPNDQVRRVSDGDTDPGLFGGGAHRGRGPKNYVRSDERIRDDINDRLSDDAWLDASDIEVAVDKGEVTLSGMVASRQDKRRAEDLVEQVLGVKHVQNSLRVQSGRDGASGYEAGMSSAGGTAGHGLTGQGAMTGMTRGKDN
jgi:Predicted periplasmic or secreted lipoprotein